MRALAIEHRRQQVDRHHDLGRRRRLSRARPDRRTPCCAPPTPRSIRPRSPAATASTSTAAASSFASAGLQRAKTRLGRWVRRLEVRIGVSVVSEAMHRRYNAAMPTLTFHGAARTVTGSKHLLEVDGRRILIDCGQFQGRKDLRLLNWTQFPFDPKTLDAVVLTHAHLDHSGLLPRLVAQRLQGPHLLHARHAGAVRPGPARRRPDPGRGRQAGQQVRLLEARAGAAAVHRERRRCAR